MKERPNLLVVQNPSMILTLFAIINRRIFGYKLVVDAHNSGIFPFEGRYKLFLDASRFIQRHADLIIVTNPGLQDNVLSNGGKCCVLPDKLPTVPEIKPIALEGKINIAYICSFSKDEPFQEVIKAAQLLDSDTVIYFTGNYKDRIIEKDVPSNIRLLGFVSEEKYWSLLFSADIIMDLTLREHCLVCGAYESISLGKPLILSNTKALRSYFSKGCLYVHPTPLSIAEGVTRAIREKEALGEGAIILREELGRTWENQFEKFKSEIFL